MKYVAIFHANLNYAYLTPDRYEFVIRESYELLLDTMAEAFPDVKFVFEASGYTVEQIALRAPDVLKKLKTAIADGRCEFMGSPYAHPMLPNFPQEDGEWSIRFSNETYETFLDITPRSFWNPECGWRDYVPHQVANCGYANMVGDFEAYSRSLNPDGSPQRPEIYEKEKTDETAFYNFGFTYNLPGDERAIHFPFDKIHGMEEGKLRMFLRTDRVAQFGVRFFMGMEGYTLETYLDLVRKYSQQKPDEPEGAVIIFADDAEYIGTNGWFRLKYQNKPDNVFERVADAREKLIGLISACKEMGNFATFDEACRQLPALNETITFDDDTAWHGGTASTWASTPMAKLLRPWQDLVREKLHAANLDPHHARLAWLHLTNSYNSDGQWPPTLPDAPHIIHPFNYGYCFENLLRAHLLVGGVDLDALEPRATATCQTILALQQDLVLAKAEKLGDRQQAQAARTIIETSRDLGTLGDDARLLYPGEYAVRAEALVEARRLVGGVEIEKTAAGAEQFTNGDG
jgi:hypothetical protein